MGNVDGVSKRLNKADDIYPVREYPELKKELERILTEKLEPFFKR